jgi:glycosyltransferase involved in cell wall biosynthesis
MAEHPMPATHQRRAIAAPVARRTRILAVIDSLPQGGAEQLLVTLATYIDSAAYDLRVCSLHPLDESSSIVQALRKRCVPIYSLGGPLRHDPRHVLRLAALVRRQRIDVVHTHLPYANTIGTVAGALTRRPVIATLHNIRDAHRSRRWSKQILKMWALRWGPRVIIACAPEVGAAARARLHPPPRKLIVVPNGIDVAAFRDHDHADARATRRELLGEHAGPLIVSVGNLVPGKGHQYLVTATARLLEHYPDVRVVIVGRLDRNEASVRQAIAAHGLMDRVLLAGQRRDVAAVLKAADLFALPSLWEGLPLALLEAMAAGTPVVATSVGGVTGVVEDRVTGRLVPPASAEALAEAMLEALAQPCIARRRADAARAHIQATYAAEVWARRIETIYSGVLHP